MASVRLEHIDKIFSDGTHAVNDLNLNIEDGELMVLVGPSGCGKTTVLRMVAGLEEISAGELVIGDRRTNELEGRDRDIAMVFQNYALYPHMTVFDNIAFPLRSQHVPRREIEERVNRTAKLLGLDELLRRRPRHLSGGQRQRVAMGRAIVREPKVFLMDEPLSNLDAKLRVQMRAEIASLQRKLGVTMLYVTHDQVEAMTMGDRIAVMRKGVLQQEGHPQKLYDEPANLFVATFIGSPATNLFECAIERDKDRLACRVGDRLVPLPPELDTTRVQNLVGTTVAMGVRPEHLKDGAVADHSWPRISGEVAYIESLGFEQLAYVRVNARPVLVEEVLEASREEDETEIPSINDTGGVMAVARFESGSRLGPNQPVELAIRPDGLQLFDLNTGSAITMPEPGGASRPAGRATGAEPVQSAK